MSNNLETTALLCDFGSTYTKLTVVDLDKEAIVAKTRVTTSIDTHLEDGLKAGEEELRRQGVDRIDARLACSSAAGGLKMAVSGLMPELTVEAATRAALGAGAKVWRVYSHELTPSDVHELNESPPDIFLLTGGTDGGNKANILSNARILKSLLKRSFPIVVAGNRVASAEISEILSDFSPVICENVMPRLGVLQVDAVQQAIRHVFLTHIVNAKGLDDVAATLSAPLIPTPSAVLEGVSLLSKGHGESAGLGDLMAVDVGGATTDVYSIGSGLPSEANITQRGLPEPFAKRTVEGDIGMRHSCRGIVKVAGEEAVLSRTGLTDLELEAGLDKREENAGWLAESDKDKRLDDSLAYFALKTALKRHAGQLETAYTPFGKTFIQTGKDLRPFSRMVLTGGPLVALDDAPALVGEALADRDQYLLPLAPRVLVDHNYVLSALGLLATWRPDVALRMILKELSHE